MIRSRPRAEFSNPIKRAALERSGGICECHLVPALMRILDGKPCTVRLVTGNIEYHHIIEDALRPDNSLSNAATLTKTCHALVTDLYSKRVIAQAKRREDRHNGIRRMPRQVLAGTFASGITKGFDGVPRWRDSGNQWPSRPSIEGPASPLDQQLPDTTKSDGPNGVVGSSLSLSTRVPALEAYPVIDSKPSP